MKNLFFVSVALCVFTVTTQAQKRASLPEDFSSSPEGIVYAPFGSAFSGTAKFVSNTTKFVSPLFMPTELCTKLQFKYGQILHREIETIGNSILYSFIDDWWGTRYRFGGNTKKGIDCSSFTAQLMNTVFGVALPRTAREQYAVCEHLTRDEMQEGDLIFFNTRGGVSHVGLYLGDGYFVHSSCGNGVTISSLSETYYSRRFISGGRPKVESSETCTG